MKNIFLIVLISFTFLGEREDFNSVNISGRLQLTIVNNKELGRLSAVTLRIVNTSNQKLYLDGILPLSFSVLKESDQGKYLEYTDGWVSNEVTNENRTEIAVIIDQETFQERGCEFVSGAFVDTFVSDFFHNQLKNKDLIKTKEDSTNLRLWICRQFSGLLYLKAHETIESNYGINSLPAGSYKIFFTYSNKNGYVRRISPFEKFEKFQLPNKLNGFERWRGDINADTLFVRIK